LVYGNGLDLWLAAALLHADGAQVTVVLNRPGWPDEVKAAMSLAWQLHIGLNLASARRQGQNGLTLSFLGSENGHTPMELSCDLAVLVQQAKPVYDIPYQLGADLVLDPHRGGYVPRGAVNGRVTTLLPGGLQLQVIGEAAGHSPAALFGCSGEDTRS
jgi:hypothetical protein